MKKSIISFLILIIIIILVDAGLVLNGNSSISGEVSKMFNSKSLTEEKVITKIIDGDTVVVEGGEHVRLLGIDCDEKGKACYKTANQRLEELTLGKKATLEWESEDKDQYGRSLRYIIIGGKNINLQMVEEGICVARFYQDSKYKEAIQQAESYAIANKLGCKWKNS